MPPDRYVFDTHSLSLILGHWLAGLPLCVSRVFVFAGAKTCQIVDGRPDHPLHPNAIFRPRNARIVGLLDLRLVARVGKSPRVWIGRHSRPLLSSLCAPLSAYFLTQLPSSGPSGFQKDIEFLWQFGWILNRTWHLIHRYESPGASPQSTSDQHTHTHTFTHTQPAVRCHYNKPAEKVSEPRHEVNDSLSEIAVPALGF